MLLHPNSLSSPGFNHYSHSHLSKASKLTSNKQSFKTTVQAYSSLARHGLCLPGNYSMLCAAQMMDPKRVKNITSNVVVMQEAFS